jgi:hypothetical protein
VERRLPSSSLLRFFQMSAEKPLHFIHFTDNLEWHKQASPPDTAKKSRTVNRFATPKAKGSHGEKLVKKALESVDPFFFFFFFFVWGFLCGSWFFFFGFFFFFQSHFFLNFFRYVFFFAAFVADLKDALVQDEVRRGLASKTPFQRDQKNRTFNVLSLDGGGEKKKKQTSNTFH